MTRANRFKTKGAPGAILLAAAVVLGAGALGALSLGCSTEDEIQFGDPLCPANRCKDDVAGASSGGSVGTTDCPEGVDGSGCPSWKDDIFGPIVDTNGAGQCATSGCHSGPNASDPVLAPGDAQETRMALLTYEMKASGGRYISCVEPDDSKILCNLSETGACGLPMPPGTKLDQTQIDQIKEWIKCGAPDN